MIVPINKQYRIITDPYQWLVQKKHARKDRDAFVGRSAVVGSQHNQDDRAIRSLGNG